MASGGEPRPTRKRRALPKLTGRYRDRELIGVGGMAEVREALDRHFGRPVALKILAEELAQDQRHVARFVEEAQVTAQLDHPSVVPVYDMGVEGRGLPCFSMKRVEGRTLEDEIEAPRRDEGSADPTGFVRILIKICEGLAFAHDRGWVHTDLKPANIMVGRFGEVYIMDWGLARRIGAENPHLAGTLEYMPPEQARCDPLDGRADVFALGGVLYHYLTGQPPFPIKPEDGKLEVLRRIVGGQITPPEELGASSRELARIAMAALRAPLDERLAGVATLQAELEAYLAGAWRQRELSYAAGDLIIREGEIGEAAYFLLRGRCRVFQERAGREHALRELAPGESFGEMAMLTSAPRSASVQALSDVVVRAVDRAAFDDWLDLDGGLSAFFQFLARRLRERDEELHALRRREAEASAAFEAAISLAAAEAGRGLKALCDELAAGSVLNAAELQSALARRREFILDRKSDRIILAR